MATLKQLLVVLVLGVATCQARLFPYGAREGDIFLPQEDDATTGPIALSADFRFYNVSHNTLFISTNGAVTFVNELDYFIPERFPLGDNYVIIAPFWSDITTDPYDGYGNITYRQMTDQTLASFEQANQIVRTAFPAQRTFAANWLFVVTWDRVAFFGSLNFDVSNTFQCVLVSDGQFSGVIFIYDDIQWTSAAIEPTPANEYTGLGGLPAEAGFNAGDAENYYVIPGSGTPDIVDIDTTSNIGQPGVWAFRVDGTSIKACEAQDLAVSPKAVPMLGGTPVFLSGPCFDESLHVLVCDFDGVTVAGVVRSQSEAMCVTPTLFVAGVIDVRLSLDGGANYTFTRGMVVSGDLPSNVLFTDWDAAPSSSLTVSWEATSTSLEGVTSVEVVVYEYTENDDGYVVWSDIHSLTSLEGVPRTDGAFEFVNEELPQNGSGGQPRIGAIGIMELDATSDGVLERRAIWGPLQPLNWLFPANKTRMCSEWVRLESSQFDWLIQRTPCPCSAGQARQDKGAFTVFWDCSREGDENDPRCGLLGSGPEFCVESTSPGSLNSGQECCYDQSGSLLDQDAAGAGLSQRVHPRATSPYWASGLRPVAVFSHFLADTAPYLQCCGGADGQGSGAGSGGEGDALCSLYKNVRPAQTCYGYEPPQVAAALGDPHYITFDGLNYTFNGYGEFTLVNASNEDFLLQARSLPMRGTPNATFFTAVACRTSRSDTVHIEAERNKGVVGFFQRAGGNFEAFNFDAIKTWHLRGVTVQAGRNPTTDDVIIAFDNGVGLTVATHNGSLSVLVAMPTRYQRTSSEGLLGNFNGVRDDDLATPVGDWVPVGSSMETIFDEFGNHWHVQPDRSLFYYRHGEDQSAFTNHSYRPSFKEPETPFDRQTYDVCGTDKLCAFDWLMTNNSQFAANTMTTIDQYRSAVEDLSPVTCPELVLQNGNVESRNPAEPGLVASFRCDNCYELRGIDHTTCLSTGSWAGDPPSCQPRDIQCPMPVEPKNGNVVYGLCHATFTCYGRYHLVGESMLECLPTGQWTAPFPVCESTRDKGSSMTVMQGAVIGGCLGLIVLIIILVIVCLIARRHHQKRKQQLNVSQLHENKPQEPEAFNVCVAESKQ